MTGFGRGEVETAAWRVTVDVRTVNHRHLDVDVRGLNVPVSLETAMKKRVGQFLSRGKCEVSVTLRPVAESVAVLTVNEPLVRAHVDTLRRLRDELGLAGEVSLSDLVLLPWNRAFEISDPPLGDEGEAAAMKALGAALTATVATRAREGQELHQDLSARLAILAEKLELVRGASDGIAEAQRKRLLQRLEALASDVAIDEQRLAQEAALLADRSDISEEITRFAAYLERLGGQLADEGPQGKRLDFVLQETLREANTMGSKSRGLDISHAVIDMKSELERMREQVANVE